MDELTYKACMKEWKGCLCEACDPDDTYSEDDTISFITIFTCKYRLYYTFTGKCEYFRCNQICRNCDPDCPQMKGIN